MKRFKQFFHIVFLVSIVSSIQVNVVMAQRSTKTTLRDHRSKAKTGVRSRVPPPKVNVSFQKADSHYDSIKVSSRTPAQKIIARDHRTQPKKKTVRDHRNQPRKATVRDHRNHPARFGPVKLKNPAKSKNYRLNVFGKYVPFTPPFNVPKGFVAKGLGHCVSIPCPEGFGEDTVCWRCTEPPAPKPSAPDTKATRR